VCHLWMDISLILRSWLGRVSICGIEPVKRPTHFIFVEEGRGHRNFVYKLLLTDRFCLEVYKGPRRLCALRCCSRYPFSRLS
jgi:hypothetical protein